LVLAHLLKLVYRYLQTEITLLFLALLLLAEVAAVLIMCLALRVVPVAAVGLAQFMAL
jgi:hypothetical protein